MPDPDIDTTWQGLRPAARELLELRDYSSGDLAQRLASPGVPVSELLADDAKQNLADSWIPGVDFLPRTVYQQKGRGYFAEFARQNEGKLAEIGLWPQQWATALMHRDSAKGFHIHPPHIPEGTSPADWFQRLYVDEPENVALRPYPKEQWDVMFFTTGISEMILVDEREGMPRRVMRFTIDGDERPGPNNAAVIIPAGVAHALRSIGNHDLIMVYGTSTIFDPNSEGRIESSIEKAPLPQDWQDYLGGK
jgi:dTDP-4-dehydrorhamnose 3,5-epimerase-like enzyme